MKLEQLIERLVKRELTTLMEAKNSEVWKEGDKISQGKLQTIFKVFHISNKYLGPTFTFTPRIPKEPWVPIEDDFTKRVSLAPSIPKAVQAVGRRRPYVYAGDIKGYGGDEVETIDVADNFKDCPSSPGNEYGTKFILGAWLMHQIKQNPNSFSKKTIKKLDQLGGTGPVARALRAGGGPTPKNLPPEVKSDFEGCVPDAKKTKELWVLEPTELIHVANFGRDKTDTGKGLKHRGPVYTLTDIGAGVLNAVGSKADEIPYGQ